MKKIDIENNNIFTKKELHDYMYEGGLQRIERTYNKMFKVNKEELSQLIYEYIDYITKHSKEEEIILSFEVCINRKEFYKEFYKKFLYKHDHYQEIFKYITFFEYQNDKYIYWTNFPEKKDKENYQDNIECLTCITENFDNLNVYEKYLNYLLKHNKYLLKELESKTDPLCIKEAYDKYDYIKILNTDNRKKIYEKDLKLCTNILGFEETTKLLNLTNESKMCLLLIIFYSLRNIYFDYTDLKKYPFKELYENYITNIPDWMEIFIQNKDDINDKKVYSKEYDTFIDLKNEINTFVSNSEDNYKLIRPYSGLYSLKETLRLIYFDYLINKGEFKAARDYINNNPIKLYNEIELIIEMAKMCQQNITSELIDEVILDYCLKVDDLDYNRSNYNLNDIFKNKEYISLYLKPSLTFIMNYVYLLQEENRNQDMDSLYSFIKVFDKGFGIEELLIKFEYKQMAKKLNELKVAKEEESDKATNKMHELIEKNHLVDKFDIEKVPTIYPNINFNNLDEKVKKYIATGDTIMKVFNTLKNDNFDYSSAVIEWSKAVELESYNKLTSKIKKYAKDINKNKTELAFKFKDTIGTFKKIDDCKMKDGRNMTQYLYDEYYKNIYYLDIETYRELIKNIIKINEPRNKSAHKNDTISYETATECQNIILSAKKILEILSNLKEKTQI